MVMEYASEGELFDYVQRRGYVGDGDLCRIMGQIFSAVEYLHGRNIVHRDLKLVCVVTFLALASLGATTNVSAGESPLWRPWRARLPFRLWLCHNLLFAQQRHPAHVVWLALLCGARASPLQERTPPSHPDRP